MKWTLQILLIAALGVSPACMHSADRTDRGTAIVPDPGWTCGMPDGIPSPECGVPVFTVELELGRICDLGETPYGLRQVIVVADGKVAGPGIQATVMPGGLDFQLTLSNGTMEIEQLLVLQTHDGHTLFMRNSGVGPDARDVRVVMDFEAPNNSPHARLNTGRFVARRHIDAGRRTMLLTVYDVSGITATPGIQIVKPADRPAQSWDNQQADPSEEPDEMIAKERVTLGDGMSVGSSKRGVRHIIPITGGELTGHVHGKVLPGGADYQLQTDNFTLDARYLWRTDEGEIIIVRNTGTFGSLRPVFEARINGPYAWLNQGPFLSGDPNGGDGAVSLEIYTTQRKES